LLKKKAVTETGEEVILFEDGTWKYEDTPPIDKMEIALNPKEFKKSPKASFLLKSTRLDMGFWMDSKLWTFKKATNNPSAEYELQNKNHDLYGMIISEKIEVPLENLKELALSNARDISPDIKLIKEEYRMVNGLKVLLMQMNGTVQGIKFTYYGYYYSNENGTIQFITYSSQKLIEENITSCEDLLNGIFEIKPTE
jgi:hypothetical protein